MRVLLTGANGFVGRAVAVAALRAGLEPVYGVRTEGAAQFLPPAALMVVGQVDGGTNWGRLGGIDAVIHLAARAHRVDDAAGDPLSEYRRVNVEGTRNLLRAAVEGGVRRFVLVSTIKVNGERSEPGDPFRATDSVAVPTDPYARSKWEAEEGLWEMVAREALEGVVVRPPLVYGPHVTANFLSLLRAVHRGIPLPLGAVDNERSLVFVDNLADLLVRCVQNSAAAGETFLVSDGAPVSTPTLVRQMGAALGKPARLIPVPEKILRLVGAVTGRSRSIGRLLGSLAVDDETTRTTLGWTPPVSFATGLGKTADWYLS
jgi:nucleoside-diphosphate-sugar epimerase